MSAKDDGGPAFPTLRGLNDDGYGYQSARLDEGMSLRDYFAAKAVQGLIGVAIQAYYDNKLQASTIAEQAYVFADAMLEARKK